MKKLLIIILFLASCSKTPEPDTLRMNLGTEPPTLDWNRLQDYNSMDIVANIMIGLTRFSTNNNGEAISIPGCALSWDISEDGLSYLFHLDPQAQWTDGQAVVARNFIDSYTRMLDPATAAPYADLISMIDIQNSKAINDHELLIKLKHPTPYFIYLSSSVITYPIRLDLIDKYGSTWTEPQNLITNGPYKLKKWQHEYKILLERNDDFFQSKANIKYLKYFMVSEQSSAYTLFLNNQFDWIDGRSIPASEYKNLPEGEMGAFSVNRYLLLRNSFVGFNHKKTPLDDKRVRQAMSFAIDRKLFTQIRSKGDVANNTWIPPSLSSYLDTEQIANNFEHKFKTPFKQDGFYPELARSLLAQAGYPEGKNFPELELAVPSREDTKLQAETLQAIWKQELNIKIKITTMEWKVFLARLRQDPPDLFRSNWGADYPDPDSFMALFTTNNPFNDISFHNNEYDYLVKTAAETIDTKKRRALYTRAEEILSQEEAAIAPLYIDRQSIIKKPWVKNFVYNPMDLVFLDRVQKD
ncbi:MAG: peptide ABC transporter substrate-binding protein [Cyanobacteria bacterium]|nr:peptide ABC transporter substrate-binding protein [Cyanobacteriota bacterium]MDA1021114.1 peptide ABC transporter substrate-binding protein [Cyanobacteriota bacterium]